MQGNVVRSEAAPLLEDGDGEDNHQLQRGNCLSRFWDCDELKNQLLIAFPMILTNVFYYAITLVSVMFAGHLGELELAGATLGNSWATVTGFAFMTGLKGGLETLCGQGFGAGVYRMLGIYLQSSCIISFFFSVLISILWIYTEPILILLQQDPRISKTAALYTKCLIPGIFAYGFLQNGLRFLQTQSVVTPLILLSAIPAAIHFGVVYGMVHGTSLGFKGGPIAASVSLWVSVLSIGVYIVFSKKFKRTMEGFSVESFHYILPGLKLALPSAAMVCLEYWAFEILVLLAGLMPNSEITTSLTAMCVNTEAISFMTTYGLSAAASTRVSNELGAGNPNRAKTAMFLSVKLSVLLAAATVLLLAFGHNLWAGFFTSSSLIIGKFGSVTPLLAISITLDSVQGVLSGVARGCCWQHLAVYTNLATFYLIGMPVAVLLAFKVKLYFKGLWIGLICGLATQTCTLLVITLRRKWTAIDFSSERVKETPDFV